MRKQASPKSKARRPTRKESILDHLDPAESARVLRQLLAAHPDLLGEAERTARSVLAEVDCEDIASDVEDAVRTTDDEDLNARAGRHAWGYVEPTEAAWEILEEAVEPFIRDMKRSVALGMETEALEICKGVVLGLYRAARGPRSAVLEHASDFPLEAAGRAVETWLTGGGARNAPGKPRGRRKRLKFPQEFLDQSVPEWRESIEWLLS